MVNGSNRLLKFTRFQQRAVDTASQVADTVRITDTEDGCQLAQRTGRSLTAKPRGEVSGDAPPRSIRPTGPSGTTWLTCAVGAERLNTKNADNVRRGRCSAWFADSNPFWFGVVR